MRPRGAVARGALIGLSIGLLIALRLLWLGNWNDGGEAMEVAAIWASIAGFPLSGIAGLFGWGGRADQWMASIVLLVPANWTLLGAAAGGVARVSHRRKSQIDVPEA